MDRDQMSWFSYTSMLEVKKSMFVETKQKSESHKGSVLQDHYQKLRFLSPT